MAGTRKCKECGRPISEGMVYCECGAWVGVEDVIQPVGIPVETSKLDQFDSSIDKMLGSDLPSLTDVDIDFSQEDQKGRPFKPLAAIGQKGDEVLLEVPFALYLQKDGDILISDFLENGDARFQKFAPDGNLTSLVCQIPSGEEAEALDNPVAFCSDHEESIWVLDSGMGQLKCFDQQGNSLAVLGEEGMEEGQLLSPADLVFDPQGNLWIADTDNNRLVKWTKDGQTLQVLGVNEFDEEEDWLLSGTEEGEFDAPQAVTLDPQGNIFVADTGNHRIQKFSPQGEFLLAFGEYGKASGELYLPNRVVVDETGDIFVSEENGSRIQKFSGEGNFLFQINFPSSAGSIKTFCLDTNGHIVVLLPAQKLAMVIEVE